MGDKQPITNKPTETSQMNTITVPEVLDLITGAKGHIFSCKFVKRTTGEVRSMTCRVKVKKGVKGIGMSYKPSDKNLLPVFDMQNDGFRMINLDTIFEVKVEGTVYEVNSEVA